MDKVRINKFLSERGICSRREADRLVEEGRLVINGHIAVNGEKVCESDVIELDGEAVSFEKSVRRVVLAYNKPAGVICSMADQAGDGRNISAMIGYPERVYPMGRLDKESEGLILLTNDGALNDYVIRAGQGHEKEYEVTVDRKITGSFLREMSEGVDIILKDDRHYRTKPCKTYQISADTFGIILTEGKNRQIRRMCESLHYGVLKLKRIRVMTIELGTLETGDYRELSEKEINTLYNWKPPADGREAHRKMSHDM